MHFLAPLSSIVSWYLSRDMQSSNASFQDSEESSFYDIENQSEIDNSTFFLLNDGSQYNDDLLVVAAWTAMGIFGFVTNLLILIGILHTKKLYQSTSYWLIISLSICDMAMILICLCHLAPATVLHERYVTLIDFSNAFGIFIYDGFWYTGVMHLMIMSINRYVSICQPKYYLKFFSRQKTGVIIGSLYVMGIVVAVPGLFKCCYLVFNSEIYAAQYEPADTAYRFVDMAINGSSIVVMTFCYSCIVIRVRRSRVMLHQYRKLYKEQRSLQTKAALVYASSRNNRDNISSKFARLLKPNVPIISRREVRLFFQFATVSVIFFATVATWGWLPQLSESKWVGFVVTSLFFLNNSTNPTVYLIFNSILRRQIERVLCPLRVTTSSKASKRPRRRTMLGHDDGGLDGAGPGHGHIGAEKPAKKHTRGGSAFLQRLRQTTRKADPNAGDGIESGKGPYPHADRRRRRSTIFDPDEDDNRLLRTYESGDYNETTDNLATNNATCNLMAMAAFLNTTTVTGRVLMKTMHEEEMENLNASVSSRRMTRVRSGSGEVLFDYKPRRVSRNPLLASKENSAIGSSGVATTDGSTPSSAFPPGLPHVV